MKRLCDEDYMFKYKADIIKIPVWTRGQILIDF